VSRGHHLTPQQQFNLNTACRTIEDAIKGDFVGVFLVGSVLERRDFRDVDVRVMVDDATFTKLFPDTDPANTHVNPYWMLICTALSDRIAQQTGLPIDLQIQQMTWANENHGGPGKRMSLGWFFERST
jgi:hypothetical protein